MKDWEKNSKSIENTEVKKLEYTAPKLVELSVHCTDGGGALDLESNAGFIES